MPDKSDSEYAAPSPSLSLGLSSDGLSLNVGRDVVALFRAAQQGRTPGLLRRLLGRENLFFLESAVVEKAIERIAQGESIPLNSNTLEGVILATVLAPRLRQIANLGAIGARALSESPSATPMLAEGEDHGASATGKVESEEEQEEFFERFREYASRVSTTDLQELWGRLLARRVEDPQNVSLITLEKLRILSRSDARSFERLAHLIISGELGCIFPRPESAWMELYHKRGLGFLAFQALEEAGLVHPGELTISAGHGAEPTYYAYGKRIIRREPGQSPVLMVMSLTRAGEELAAIPATELDEEWFKTVLKWIAGSRDECVSWREWTSDAPVASSEQLAALFE